MKPPIIDRHQDEIIVISPNDVSKLFHTRLKNARFGELRPTKSNWKSIQILALTSVLDACKDIEELCRISRANIVRGHKRNKGFFYIQSHNISCQGESEPKIASIVELCSQFLWYEVYLEFE
ncbi:MAG: hypothetical protein OXD45_04835 [Rhodobacteraceae bacterium]|nr:hypothetical protein [Paracoccaceae bacterium]